MSKRAEKLARQIKMGQPSLEVPAYRVPLGEGDIAALIDAELRKERERCAERAVEHALGQGWISDSANGDGIALCAAVLSEEER